VIAVAQRGKTVTYLYWSERRTGKFLEDNGIELPSVTYSIGTPGFKALPTFSKSTTRKGALRPQVASRIERKLGQSAVTAFESPGPISYAKGTGSMVFGEFRTFSVDTEGRQPAVIFTAGDYGRERGSVAICLFGSMDNFAGYIQKAGARYPDGWYSSDAPYVFQFLQSGALPGRVTPEYMAMSALTIAISQGNNPYTGQDNPTISNLDLLRLWSEGRPLEELWPPRSTSTPDDPTGFDRPWLRGFTYGDLQDSAEWLAQIYLDVDLVKTGGKRREGFRRVLVGAPFWIRTANPQALSLYGKRGSSDSRPLSQD
jgi:hypothetical protein